jgi:hypothetical protein
VGGNHTVIKIAAYSFSAIAFLAVAFHGALALGMPWAELSWGGQYSGRLPAAMRVASVASAAILVLLALVVLVRAGLLLPRWHSLSQKLIWVVVTYCGVAVLAHIFTPSKWERIVWLPMVVVLFITALVVARREIKPPHLA